MKIIRFYAFFTIALGMAIGGIVVWWIVAKNQTVTLTLVSGQEGGVYFPLAQSIAEIIERADGRIKVEVVPTAGTGENLNRIASGEADLAIVQNDVTGHAAVRTLVPLHNGVLHFWVRASSDIHSFSDLRGKVLAVGLEESGTPQLVDALFRHFEIGGDAELRQLPLNESCAALLAGEVDAVLMTMGLKAPAFEQLVDDAPVRLVGIGEATDEGSAIGGFRLTYPFVQPRSIPRYAYAPPKGGRPGVPPRPVPAIGIRAILVTHEALPRDLAKRITGALIEGRAALAKMHPSAAELTEHFDAAHLQFPIHGGAAAYYHRDEPGFLKQNAELLGFLMSLVIAFAGFFLSARQWLVRRQKDRIDVHYLRLDQLLSDLRKPELSDGDLAKMDDELLAIRKDAVAQLAAEKLLPNESFRIFQSLLSDCEAAVRRRTGIR